MFSRHKVKISQALHLAAARVAALLHFPAIGVDINRPPHVQWYTLTMHDVAGLVLAGRAGLPSAAEAWVELVLPALRLPASCPGRGLPFSTLVGSSFLRSAPFF